MLRYSDSHTSGAAVKRPCVPKEMYSKAQCINTHHNGWELVCTSFATGPSRKIITYLQHYRLYITILKCPNEEILNISHTLTSRTPAVSDYLGVIIHSRESITQRKNMEICKLLYKRALCPQQPSTLVEVHILLAQFQG